MMRRLYCFVETCRNVFDKYRTNGLCTYVADRDILIMSAGQTKPTNNGRYIMELYVYKMVDGVTKTWDDVNFQLDCEIVAVVTGEDNEDCETKAFDNGYANDDIYGFTYTKDIPESKEIECIGGF